MESVASHVLVLALSLAALVKGADWFVEFAGRVARRLGVSDLVIGLTITSIGTSLPELASSVSASAQGQSGLAIGNVVGANIANIGLIFGAAAVARPFATRRRMHDRDGFVMVAATGLLFLAVLNNELNRWQAAGFVVVYVAYIAFAARTDRDDAEVRFADFMEFFFKMDYTRSLFRWRRWGRGDPPSEEKVVEPGQTADRKKLLLEIAAGVLACALVVLSARYLVAEAVWAAEQLGVPESLVGMTLVALGTTQPELVIAITAARRGNGDIVVGNVMGSNIANTLLVLGLSGVVRPLQVPESSVVRTIPVLIFFSLGLLYLIKSGWRVTRRQGLLALACYAIFIATAIVQR